MKVSIIIPVYNVSAYIKDCITSVFNQTYKDLEVIIVNDKTTDDSMRIIHSLLQDNHIPFPVKIVEHDTNKGLSSARNTGIRHPTGQYIYFLDSDDEITADCIETLATPLLKEPHTDIVIGDYKVTNSDSFFPPLKLKDSFLKGHATIVKAYMKEKIYVMAWNKLTRKEFITKNHLFFKEGLIHEDVLWSFQCMCKAKMVGIVKKTTYIYKIHPASIKTGTRFSKDYEANKTVITGLVDFAVHHRLLNNKYVSSYIEEEKVRLMYSCIHANAEKDVYKLPLYDFVRNLPHANLARLLSWDFFSIKKLIRDAHYYILSYENGMNYFWSIPDLWIYKKTAFMQARFYAWFLTILFCRIFLIKKIRMLEPSRC